MRRTTILADDALLLEARALATRRGVTFTDVVREALKEYIAANNESRLSIVGIGRSDTGDIAARAEAILAEEIDPHEGWSPDRNRAGSSRKRGQ